MTRKDREKLMNNILKEIPQETVELFIDYLSLYYWELLEMAEAFEGIVGCEDSVKIYQHMASGVSACSINLKFKINCGCYLDPDKRKDI